MKPAILFLFIAAMSCPIAAQESDPFAPAEKLSDGWEQIDQRLVFLMVRLVDVEANLEAIDKAMGKSKLRAGLAQSKVNRAQAGNDRMDRRAGGPVRWDKFYGTTAEKFFYHPTDNHTYHTRTILSHRSPGRDNQSEPGVPSRQGLPVHQRPPQFDYMYRANESAQKRATANVAKFRGNAAALAARHHELQLEQSKLWCEIAFRAVARNDLDRKPLYRFAPSGSGKDDLLAATRFVVTALSIVANGQKDQATTFRGIKQVVAKSRYELGNKWLQLGVKYRDESTDQWRFAKLARRLEDISANLGDSYTVSVEREQAGDSARRDLYRGFLQDALLQYAQTVLALDEMASEMAKASNFEADLQNPLAVLSMPAPTLDSSAPQLQRQAIPNNAVAFQGSNYKFFREHVSWKEAQRRCESMGGNLANVESSAENAFIHSLARRQYQPDRKDGLWLGASDEQSEGNWKSVSGDRLRFTNWGKGQPNNKQNAEHFLMMWIGNDGSWSDQPERSHQHTTYFVCEWN